MPIEFESSAIFSPCRTWRYMLTRTLDVNDDPMVLSMGFSKAEDDPLACLFVCLNPSTADETTDDPTVRRCIRFARRWGYSKLTVCNIFALRSTDPKALYLHDDPVGLENDEHIAREAARHDLVVAAWGNHGEIEIGGVPRGRRVDRLLRASADGGIIHALGMNGTGQPKHPLYLRADTWPTPWIPGVP
jgi:hypothetical protein